MKISGTKFIIITLLIVLIPIYGNWKLLLHGEETEGIVVKTIEKDAGMLLSFYSIIAYQANQKQYTLIGPENIEYQIGKKFSILYLPDAPATQHADDIKKRSKGLKIPHIEPWDFAWADGDSPETADIIHTHSTITAHHVLQSALALEKGAQNFYVKITKENLDKDIILLAAEFAEEENEHVELLQNWVSRYPKTNE